MVEKRSDAALALGESGDESHLAARLLYLIAAMPLFSSFSLQTRKGILQSPSNIPNVMFLDCLKYGHILLGLIRQRFSHENAR